MQYIEMSNQLLKALHQYVSPLLARCSSPAHQRLVYEKYYPLILQYVRKWYAQNLNPFKLCPRTIMIWLLIRPYNAIGISLFSLNEIAIYWRQQMEPNETVFLLLKIMDLHVPFPLMLLITFGTIGLVVTDGANRLVTAAQTQFAESLASLKEKLDSLGDAPEDPRAYMETTMADEERKQAQNWLDPFNLTPRMSVYFPIYNYHTTLGILLMDFRHLEISLKQSLEPNETLVSLIRVIDVYSPFPLPIMVMLLSIGLFMMGKIHDANRTLREEILNEVKRSMP